MDGGTWQAISIGSKSRTRLSDFTHSLTHSRKQVPEKTKGFALVHLKAFNPRVENSSEDLGGFQDRGALHDSGPADVG